MLLKQWFLNRLETIIKHNSYEEGCITVKRCEEKNLWTPVDLIIREELNNGGGSAKGFLGISTSECHKCFKYIKENKKLLIDLDLINENGYNNFGITLWTGYKF